MSRKHRPKQLQFFNVFDKMIFPDQYLWWEDWQLKAY